MVKVANDGRLRDGDLPAAPLANRDSRSEADVSGISLRLIAGLAATAQGSVLAPARRLDATVDSTLPLREALKRTEASGAVGAVGAAGGGPDAVRTHGPVGVLAHCLVLTDAAELAYISPAEVVEAVEGQERRGSLRRDSAGRHTARCRQQPSGTGCRSSRCPRARSAPSRPRC